MSATLPPPPSDDAVPSPEPRPSAQPLDRAEERSLARLENELKRSDPELDTEMTELQSSAADATTGNAAPINRILQSISIAVILLLLVPSEWLAGLLSFGLLLGFPLAMVLMAERARREAQRHCGEDGAEGDGLP